MSVYWRNVKMGQNLIIENDKGHEEVIGGYRERPANQGRPRRY